MNTFQSFWKRGGAQRRVIAGLALVLALTSAKVQTAEADVVFPQAANGETLQVVRNDTEKNVIVVPKGTDSASGTDDAPAVRVAYATITAYASIPGETDDSPFVTADGSHVADGIVAANWLKFGTRIRIPQLSGDKVYVVHDRMNKRYSDRVDVWVPTVAQENAVGLRRNYKIEIL
jgi:3D (Asp-Asp-Asp) domain-containing protein